jgi:hypothetical protein
MPRFPRSVSDSPPPSPGRHGLNTAQCRALTTVLTRLEQAITRWEERLGQAPTGADLLTRWVNQPSPLEQTEIRSLLARMRQEVHALAAAFQLPTSAIDGRRALAAEFAILWADLEDTRPSALTRYGAVDPTLETTLAPRIDLLIHLALTLQHLAEQRPA